MKRGTVKAPSCNKLGSGIDHALGWDLVVALWSALVARGTSGDGLSAIFSLQPLLCVPRPGSDGDDGPARSLALLGTHAKWRHSPPTRAASMTAIDLPLGLGQIHSPAQPGPSATRS